MYFIRTLLVFVFIGVVSQTTIAQDTHLIDSLKRELIKAKHDTTKIKLAYELGEAQYILRIPYWDSLKMTCEGLIEKETDQLLKKTYMNYYVKSINNCGYCANSVGDVKLALSYYENGLLKTEKQNDLENKSLILVNVAAINSNMGNYDKSLIQLNQALAIRKELNNINDISNTLMNIGNIHIQLENYEGALQSLLEALTLIEKTKNINTRANIIQNIGLVYTRKKEYRKALWYLLKAFNLFEKQNRSDDIQICLRQISNIYIYQKDFSNAERYGFKSFLLAQKIGNPILIKQSSSSLYTIYKATNRFDKALEMYELHIKMRDSITNQDNKEHLIKTQLKYEYESKAIQDSLYVAEERKINAIKSEQAYTQRVALVVGLLLVLAFALFMVNRFRVTNKQKQLIEQQKLLVDEKQKEILDSITYAKRLQQAILPTDELIKQHLPQSFVLYLPKDIVAGDFYWLESFSYSPPIGGDKEEGKSNLVFIAAADCTGHGVPGAMVSVVCANALNRSVLEFGLNTPGDILNKTRDLVVDTLAKNNSGVQDGMDISLACLNTNTLELTWVGANNPLWYIQNNTLLEIKPNKQSVCKVDNPLPFKSHTVQLQKGDMFYLFTDGYADQFGGPDKHRGEKKFKYKALQEILVKHCHADLAQQHDILKTTFDNWKGTREQTDDVCIIGVRV